MLILKKLETSIDKKSCVEKVTMDNYFITYFYVAYLANLSIILHFKIMLLLSNKSGEVSSLILIKAKQQKSPT